MIFLSLLQGRAHIFKIHARSMSVDRDIRYELLARLCPNSTGMSRFFYIFCVIYWSMYLPKSLPSELACCWITMTILDKSLKSNLYSIDGIFVHVVKDTLTDFSTKRSNCYRRPSVIKQFSSTRFSFVFYRSWDS